MSLFYLLYIECLSFWKMPEWLIFIMWYIFNFILIVILMLLTVLFLVLFERKYLAFYTRRIGPDRAGYKGCFQTVADAIKLLFKENIIPKNADKFLFFLSPLIVFVPVLTVWALLPFSSGFYTFHSCCSILLFMAFLAIPAIGILFAGYSSGGNNFALIGGIRSCMQLIASEIPSFLVLASIVILSGSMDLSVIVKNQSGSILNWYIFPSFLGFTIFFICSLIIMNRLPFDFPEAESELVAGYNCEYSGMKFAMFFLAEYAMTFILSALVVVLFLGGYNAPFDFYITDCFNLSVILREIFINFEQFFWLIFKTGIIIMLIMLIRAAYPRLRTDKTLDLCWYIFIPLSIFNLFIAIIIKYMRGIL